MTKYKLGNIIKKNLLTYFKNSEISKKNFSFALLNELCDTYPITEFVFDYYYHSSEDVCCWQDELSCWMSDKSNDYSLNRRIYRELKKILKSNNIYNRKIWLGENNKTVFFIIPLRDIMKTDITLVFNKVSSFEN